MATILLAWELGAGSGHCVNLYPLAREFVSRGHRVVFAARDLASAARVFDDVRVSFLQAPFLVGGWPGWIARPHTLAQILHNTGFGTEEHLKVIADAWGSLMEATQPDVVICEHAPHALLAASCRGIRRFVVGTGFFDPPDVAPLPYLDPPADREASLQAIQIEKTVLDHVNAYMEMANRSPLERLSKLYADAEHHYLLTLPELDHYPHRQSEFPLPSTTYVRSWSPSGGLRPQWSAGQGPRMFGYLKPGTSNWRLNDALALLAEMKLPSIVHVELGNGDLPRRFRNSTVAIVNQRVDMEYIAREAQFAILNGNAGTATELLLAGVPQLNIPLYLEQAVFSERVTQLGAGLSARPDQPTQIAARLMALLNSPEFSDRARAVAKKYLENPLPASNVIAQEIGETLDRPPSS